MYGSRTTSISRRLLRSPGLKIGVAPLKTIVATKVTTFLSEIGDVALNTVAICGLI
jgi:hypothetical protein